MLEIGSDILARLWKNRQKDSRNITKNTERYFALRVWVLTYAMPDRIEMDALHTEGKAGGP